MKKKVFNLDNNQVNEIDLPDQVFNVKVLPDLIHRYICYQDAKKRQGSHKVKTRSEVQGKAKKPFSQKGTGNARQGSSKGPHFRGGAVSMGPQNNKPIISMNKKEKRLALKCALSEKIIKDEIIILDNLELKSNKTKDLYLKLKKFKFDSALFVYNPENMSQNFKRASNNIPKINILSQTGINVKDLINNEKIFIVQDSINKISKSLL